MRLIVQQIQSGRFLVPSDEMGEPFFTRSLKDAGGGVVFDLESGLQLLADYSDVDEPCQLVDLDRLGTAADYPQTQNDETKGGKNGCG
jgi:hypothetical protein